MKDEKELSEHRMLVDLGRNDIHRISKTGTSQITKLMTIERYEHVMHIVSEVIGELKPHLSPMSVIASLLPTGTVSGAPKLRAIQRIYESYPYKRGIYSGGVGYINCNHHLDFALAIRTMIIDEEKVSVEAGCGVVYDSIPEKELEETKLKAKKFIGGNSMILIIDNYDSFTYNLVDIVEKQCETIVKYPDDTDICNLKGITAVIISPGPGHPLDNQLLIKLIENFENLPILGVCLGAQALTCYYGGDVIQGSCVKHGKVDTLTIVNQSPLYKGIKSSFKVMRYHSLISDPCSFPESLLITGQTYDSIQSFQHKNRKHYGIQFHPESFATENGKQIIINFINIATRGS